MERETTCKVLHFVSCIMIKYLGRFLSKGDLTEFCILFTMRFSQNGFCLETWLALSFVDFSGKEGFAIYFSRNVRSIQQPKASAHLDGC